MSNDVQANIAARAEARDESLRLSAQLNEQLNEQRKIVRERLLAQNAAVSAATQNQRVQSKLAVVNANAQADAFRAQQRIQLLQARAQIRQQRGPNATQQIRSGLKVGAQVAGRKTWVDRLAGGIGDRVTRMPTPGGLFALFMILLVFIFLIVPVSATGQTRFELFWLTLLGRTRLDVTNGSEPAPKEKPASAGSSNGIAQDGFGNSLNAVDVSLMTPLPQVPFGLPGMVARHG